MYTLPLLRKKKRTFEGRDLNTHLIDC